MDYTISDYLEILKTSRKLEGGLAFDNRTFVPAQQRREFRV